MLRSSRGSFFIEELDNQLMRQWFVLELSHLIYGEVSLQTIDLWNEFVLLNDEFLKNGACCLNSNQSLHEGVGFLLFKIHFILAVNRFIVQLVHSHHEIGVGHLKTSHVLKGGKETLSVARFAEVLDNGFRNIFQQELRHLNKSRSL